MELHGLREWPTRAVFMLGPDKQGSLEARMKAEQERVDGVSGLLASIEQGQGEDVCVCVCVCVCEHVCVCVCVLPCAP